MAEQTQDPENPDHDPREAGLGPGEHGESVEEGRQAKDDERGGSEQENADPDEG
jgi:hypothetical protein